MGSASICLVESWALNPLRIRDYCGTTDPALLWYSQSGHGTDQICYVSSLCGGVSQNCGTGNSVILKMMAERLRV